MAEKRKMTPAELSEQCRRAALSRKNFRGGRKPGSGKPADAVREEVTTIAVREYDFDVIKKLSGLSGKTMTAFVHDLVSSLKSKNPGLFRIA